MIRVVVVDDHELVRSGLREVLRIDDAIDVVAEASDGSGALAAVERHHPDVVVLDLQMPGMGGIEATRRIRASAPAPAVLVLTMFDDDDSVFEAVRAGALGYVLKGAPGAELRRAVRGVASGQAVLGPGVAGRVLGWAASGGVGAEALPDLTGRERDVLSLLADDLAPVAIARRLAISEKTVRNNISTLLVKLGVPDRAAAAEAARAAGLHRRGRDRGGGG